MIRPAPTLLGRWLIGLVLAYGLVAPMVGKAATDDNTVDQPNEARLDPKTRVEIGFSPQRGGRPLVLKALAAAKHQVEIMAYLWTSREITTAVVDAARRGVKVSMLIDYKTNIGEPLGESQTALKRLLQARVAIKSTRAFAIMHNKVMLVDGRHLLTGSFNFTQSAASRNAENVLVLWDAPAVVAVYSAEWARLWDDGERVSLVHSE